MFYFNKNYIKLVNSIIINLSKVNTFIKFICKILQILKIKDKNKN